MPKNNKDKNNSKVKKDVDVEKLFKKLYLKYRERIYWYIYRKVSRTELAEDLTADVFLKLYENLPDLQDRDEKGILAWTYTVSRNLTIDHIRKVSRRNTYTMEEEDLDRVGKVFNNFVKDAIKDEEISTIKSAVDKLDEDDQEILRLRFEEDLKFKDIADIIDKKEGACKMMLYRAVDKVKDNLDKNTSKDVEEEKE